MVDSVHILFIVENNPVPRDRRVWSEAVAAREFGARVSIISPVETVKDVALDRKAQDEGGVRVYRHPRPLEGRGVFGLLIEYLCALFWEIVLSIRIYIKEPFHVIHAANPPDLIFIIALLFKVFGVKYIFDHHDIAPENYVAKFGKRGLFYFLSLLMERLSFLTADVVISTNESYREIAVKRGRKSPQDVFVVRNGPDLARIPQMSADQLLRNGFAYLVGYVGIIGQQEGIENLLKTVRHIVDDLGRSDIGFIVVGTGTDWKRVVRLCNEMHLQRVVRFTGYVPDAELYRILSSVDVCVNPEDGNEFTDRSTMIKIMEYMTFSKPVVQYYTKEGEVTAGGAAIYVRDNSPVTFAKALVELLEDRQRRETMGAIGRKRIEECLCWERQKCELMRAYDRVLGKS